MAREPVRVVRRLALCRICGALTHSGASAAWPRACRNCHRPLGAPFASPAALVVPVTTRRRQGRTWWTRERVLAGLSRFYREHACAPTSTAEWQQLTTNPDGRRGGSGTRRPYPSFYGVLRYFPTFRQAWAAAGVDVDRSAEAWTELEDWYLREGAGLLSRTELARDLQRTPDAVHRRLYDLGLHSYQRWGWTLHRVERVAQVPRHLLQTYLERGDLPYCRGSKCVYVDPADLVAVREIDWACPPAELEEAARRAWRERLVKTLAGQDWRLGQPHRPQPLTRTDRRWGPRLVRPCHKSVEIVAGDWVEVVGPVPRRPHCLGRVGLVHLVYWSSTRTARNPTRPTPEPQWMARVEFKSQHGRSRGPRVTYTLPLATLKHTNAPAVLPSPRPARESSCS